ncbi:MAG: hypothetical protein ABSH47_15225 [Bryobacteraceae bacterium]|jgi:hypothetical protein
MTVQIRDSKGDGHAALSFAVSPGRINVLIPARVATAQATR